MTLQHPPSPRVLSIDPPQRKETPDHHRQITEINKNAPSVSIRHTALKPTKPLPTLQCSLSSNENQMKGIFSIGNSNQSATFLKKNVFVYGLSVLFYVFVLGTALVAITL